MLNADTYQRANKTSAKYATILKILRDHEQLMEWSEGEAVMDAGCGPGDVTAHVLLPWLPPDIRLLLGVDISTAMVRHANAHHSAGNLKFATADIGDGVSQIVQNYKAFDKIFSFYALHWLADLKMGVKNLSSLLKPGGQMLLAFPVDRSFQKAYRIVCSEGKWQQYFKNVNRILPSFPSVENPRKEFEETLIAVGLQIVTCEISDMYSIYDSVHVLKDLIESLDTHIGCVPYKLKAQYLDDCHQAMEEMGSIKSEETHFSLKQSVITSVVRKNVT